VCPRVFLLHGLFVGEGWGEVLCIS
jgi:hypothetical protein